MVGVVIAGRIDVTSSSSPSSSSGKWSSAKGEEQRGGASEGTEGCCASAEHRPKKNLTKPSPTACGRIAVDAASKRRPSASRRQSKASRANGTLYMYPLRKIRLLLLLLVAEAHHEISMHRHLLSKSTCLCSDKHLPDGRTRAAIIWPFSFYSV